MQALTIQHESPAKPNFLIIDSDGSKSLLDRANVEWADNMVSGLSRSIANPPDVAVAVFRTAGAADTDVLVDVSRAIKRNRAGLWMIALVPELQRELIDRLYEAGVDFVRVYPAGDIDWDTLIEQWENGVSGEQSTAELLARLCPYMHDNRVEGTPGLVTCAAYRNRLVLGPKRLTSLCETPEHRECTYFKAPRPA